jgi:hypothetical protein
MFMHLQYLKVMKDVQEEHEADAEESNEAKEIASQPVE